MLNCSYLQAQDIHFSQFWTSPVQFNPASAGFFEGNGRLSVNHRVQWSAITKPYQTFAATYDLPLVKRAYKQDIFGIGISAFRDVAGDADFGTTQLNISSSYIKALTRKNNNFISIGFQAGIAQKNIFYSNLYFDEQYINGKYDPNITNTEAFRNDNFYYADIGVGALWMYQPKNKRIWNVGLSFSHLNRPSQSLFNNKEARMDIKTMITISTQYNSKDYFNVYPILMASFQGSYREIILGAQGKYYIDKNPISYLTINGGIFYRIGDAAYIMVGADYRQLQFGVSYDINISKLNIASRYQGGWEFSLNYIFRKNKIRKIYQVPCPIF